MRASGASGGTCIPLRLCWRLEEADWTFPVLAPGLTELWLLSSSSSLAELQALAQMFSSPHLSPTLGCQVLCIPVAIQDRLFKVQFASLVRLCGCSRILGLPFLSPLSPANSQGGY